MMNPQTVSADEARWAALLERRAGDEPFLYGVTTTGIYCRPGCASRRPLRANTRFFTTQHDAVAAGFRACRRCRPDAALPQTERARAIERSCRTIDEAEV